MTDLDQFKVAVGALVSAGPQTQDAIRQHVDRLRRSFGSVTDDQAEEAIREFEVIHGVTMGDGATLQESDFEPWLADARSTWDPYYWDRYRKLLVKEGFSGQVLATLDEVTDRILGLLQNPAKDGKWDRRGMVMGHVQSGKTANYTGLACKAADAGYRVIVIIAGIHNNLRNQTQRRIDEGLVGFSRTAQQRRKAISTQRCGVGWIDYRRRPAVFTTPQRDFNKQIADSIGIPLQNLTEPAVFVIKKNASTLQNLIEWLRAHNARSGAERVREPMLLIDDEADNASINIRQRQNEVSKINGQIRELLRLFDRSCYVGYTATPFANIFIDPESDDDMVGDDLFPRDFIVSLDPPSNYFGATKVFHEEADRIIVPIDDHSDLLPLKHTIGHGVSELPRSLQTAVRIFVVARAIRLVRGHVDNHNSMLVNVSRFVSVQAQIRNQIHELIQNIRGSVRVNGALPPAQAVRDPEIAALRQAFEQYYAQCNESWACVQDRLHESVSALNVVEVNQRASGSLDYAAYQASGLNVIAVGGLSLSRGLTLEGLVVSYFLRNSMMYDTLLQMGRWFGYRTGYEDLCRVWMLEEAQGWYSHIAESIDELRYELARMQSINATPTDFGLRVRSHPDTLIVTARNKMGAGEELRVQIGLANRFIETATLRRDCESLRTNRQAAVDLTNDLRLKGLAPEDGEEQANGGWLVRCAPVSLVDKFLLKFRNHELSLTTATELVRKYIRDRQDDELCVWDIFFPSLKPENASARSLVDSTLGFKLVCQRRAPGRRSDSKTLMITNKQRVSSRGIAKIGLTHEEATSAENSYNASRPSMNAPVNFPDWIYGAVRKRPLLVVHLLAIGEGNQDFSREAPVVAWSISFPRTAREEKKVEYVVNRVWQQEYFPDEDDDEEVDNDD